MRRLISAVRMLWRLLSIERLRHSGWAKVSLSLRVVPGVHGVGRVRGVRVGVGPARGGRAARLSDPLRSPEVPVQRPGGDLVAALEDVGRDGRRIVGAERAGDRRRVGAERRLQGQVLQLRVQALDAQVDVQLQRLRHGLFHRQVLGLAGGRERARLLAGRGRHLALDLGLRLRHQVEHLGLRRRLGVHGGSEHRQAARGHTHGSNRTGELLHGTPSHLRELNEGVIAR